MVTQQRRGVGAHAVVLSAAFVSLLIVQARAARATALCVRRSACGLAAQIAVTSAAMCSDLLVRRHSFLV
jgi:hypothetical protein